MTKGFKDSNGKFRPTGNSNNGVSSDSVGSNNIKKYTEPFPKLLPRTDEEKWNMIIASNGGIDIVSMLENLLNYALDDKKISRDEYVALSLNYDEKNWKKAYPNTTYPKLRFRDGYPEIVGYEIDEWGKERVDYIEGETGWQFDTFQDIAITDWKNLPKIWKNIISYGLTDQGSLGEDNFGDAKDIYDSYRTLGEKNKGRTISDRAKRARRINYSKRFG